MTTFELPSLTSKQMMIISSKFTVGVLHSWYSHWKCIQITKFFCKNCLSLSISIAIDRLITCFVRKEKPSTIDTTWKNLNIHDTSIDIDNSELNNLWCCLAGCCYNPIITCLFRLINNKNHHKINYDRSSNVHYNIFSIHIKVSRFVWLLYGFSEMGIMLHYLPIWTNDLMLKWMLLPCFIDFSIARLNGRRS